VFGRYPVPQAHVRSTASSPRPELGTKAEFDCGSPQGAFIALTACLVYEIRIDRALQPRLQTEGRRMENTNSTKVPHGAGAGGDYEIDFGALNYDWKG